MTTVPPRILLVEDDPVSRAFLGSAIGALPAIVDAADSVAAAETLANANRYDLWLFDAHLPDGSGTELLARLRVRDAATPALAHTAATDGDTARGLLESGFAEVLVKPLPSAAVRVSLRKALGLDEAEATHAAPPVDWDDEAAARALNGNREHVATLRTLFVAELPAIGERVRNAVRNEDHAGLHAELHRLRASCGFVGAVRLQQAVRSLDEAPRSHEALLGFMRALEALAQDDRPGD